MREQLIQLYADVKDQKYVFLVAFFLVILLTYGFLYAIDFIPQAPGTSSATSTPTGAVPVAKAATESAAPTLDPYPVKIIFDSLNKTVNVSNPTSTNVDVLDKYLLKGAVRYPTSATLASPGNVFILAHSSYLPTVINHNYQAFDGIQNLTWGDTVRLQTSDTEYVYRVQRVYKAKTADVVVPQTPGTAELTLATCNVFGTKEDRFIVEAVLVGSHPLTATSK